MILFAGPELPYRLADSAMATSPDGRGVILFGGTYDKHSSEDTLLELRYGTDIATLLELRYGADKWTILPQNLKQPRGQHVVIPIS